MVTVVVDTRERASGLDVLLEERGAFVHVELLPVGDYIVAEGCVVERKHEVDFRRSLVTGRLWLQIGRLRQTAREPYLLLEGKDIFGPMPADSIRGALLAIADLGVTVLRSQDCLDSAAWLYRLSYRRQHGAPCRNRPRYRQRPASPPESIPETMLAAVPGISHVTAKSLLERFGSIANLMAADPSEWRQAPGVGAARVSALARAVGVTIPSHSAERNSHRAT